ncbi:MAG: hypothetical protein DPW14_12110 [Planctomycetes bacterium]|nr:hypothetical protein [Planctomycetota bacterium]
MLVDHPETIPTYDPASTWSLAMSTLKLRLFRGVCPEEAVVAWRHHGRLESAARVGYADLHQLAWHILTTNSVFVPCAAHIGPRPEDLRPAMPSPVEFAQLPVVRHIARGPCWPDGGAMHGPGYYPDLQLLVLQPEVVQGKFANTASLLAARLSFADAMAPEAWLRWLGSAVKVPAHAPVLLVTGSSDNSAKSIVATVSGALVEGQPPFCLKRSGRKRLSLRGQLESLYRGCRRVAVLDQSQFGIHFERVLELVLRTRESGYPHSPEVLIVVAENTALPPSLRDRALRLDVRRPAKRLRASLVWHAMTTRNAILKEAVARCGQPNATQVPD